MTMRMTHLEAQQILLNEIVEKPFGKAGFGKGKYEKSPYYLKELQTNRINKKLKLIKYKLEDIKGTIDILLKKLP